MYQVLSAMNFDLMKTMAVFRSVPGQGAQFENVEELKSIETEVADYLSDVLQTGQAAREERKVSLTLTHFEIAEKSLFKQWFLIPASPDFLKSILFTFQSLFQVIITSFPRVVLPYFLALLL